MPWQAEDQQKRSFKSAGNLYDENHRIQYNLKDRRMHASTWKHTESTLPKDHKDHICGERVQFV